MDNKDQVQGKIKQAVGDLTDDEDLKSRGKTDEKAGDVKAAVGDLSEKVQDAVDKVKDKLTHD